MSNRDLSRREILAGLGVLGAGVGSATLGYDAASATLRDTEGFLANLLTAGELELSVPYAIRYDDATDGTSSTATGTVDGSDPTVQIDAISPGDAGRIDFCPSPTQSSNPGYLWLCGGLTTYEDGGRTGASSSGMGINAGDHHLGEAVQARLRYVDDTSLNDPMWCPSSETTDTGVLIEGDFVDVLETLAGGIPLDAGGTTGVSPGGQTCFSPGGGNACLRFEWCVPPEAGNPIQQDRLEFELVFRTRQCRHADGTTNPCTPDDSSSSDTQGISFIAFCTEDGDTTFDADLTVEATNAEGEPTAVGWSVPASASIDTVVLYYATTFENFYYPDTDPTSGTATVGEGAEPLNWPPGGSVNGQSPSDPCPSGQDGVKYDWIELDQTFEKA